MITVQDWASLSRVLTSPLDIRLKQLLIERRDQLAEFEDLSEIARFVVVEPGDGRDSLERELGFSVFRNPVDGRLFGDPEFSPGWEWIANHGHCFEFVFIMDDSGYGHVVFVPNEPGIDPELLRLCQAYAD
ncbi:hypothetical protein LZ496_09905 [Sphingomonas sp. NSE70-1]|uniref:Uncharacterized protein n=1 Tax=Sphingomonas caseinilyticus TaxID=2908205 RepID=A0ABT0RVQ2_9SPHN|nr:hypothetical protein [Sphingomonas caseinilyticus]MCL6699092.1 hypothetical protein [Sphingomonas caseinilyticus]